MKPRLSPTNFGNAPETLVPGLNAASQISAWADAVSWAITADRLSRFGNDAVSAHSSQIIQALDDRSSDNYQDVFVSKPGRPDQRPISVPSFQIQNLQSGILPFIPTHLAHRCSYAYESGKSAILCARQHVGMRSGIKLDLVGFFHQVRESNVRDLFRCLGANEFSANLYAKILTRLPSDLDGYRKLNGNGILPQGAPTSGAISNLIWVQLDEELDHIAAKHGLTYTRYADDLMFSSKSDEFSQSKTLEILKEIRICINRFALNINAKKTRIYKPLSSHQYLGLLIGENDVRLPKHYVRKIKSSSRALTKFGLREVEDEYANGNSSLAAHRTKTRYHSPTFLQRYVGQLCYVSQIDPSWSAALARELLGVILSDPKTWYQHYDESSKKSISATLQALTNA